jgi:polar amino acid transport system substrate-binding protein
MTSRARRRAAAALMSSATIVLGGCASVSTRAQDLSLAALATTSPTPRPPLDLGKAKESCREHPYESLAPSALPRPGHMPAGTFARTIQDRGRLVVGVDQNSLGLGYFDPGSRRMEGFDIDLVRELARAIFDSTRRIRYVAISTGQRESAIAHADVDVVASAFSITCERRNRMLFSDVYHVARQRLLVPRNSKVSGPDDPDLRGQRVCATTTSTSFRRIRRSIARTGIRPYGVALRSDCLVALQEGTVAAITADDAILLGFRRQDPQTKIVGPSLEREHWGMAVNEHRPGFVRFVNAVLRRLRRDGCLKTIARHWLSHPTVPSRDGAYARCTRRSR